MNKSFSISESIKFGWQTFKLNIGFFIKLALIVIAINIILGSTNNISKDNWFIAFIINIAAALVHFLVDMGLIRIGLNFYDKKKSQLSDVFGPIHLLLKYFLASFIQGLIILLGFILLIVPGIIFAIRLHFTSYLIIEKGLGPIEAIKTSWEMTKGKTINLLLFFLATIGLNLLGLLALVVGLAVTIPVTMLATAYVYKKLESNKVA